MLRDFTLQVFGAPVIRGSGANNTWLLIDAPYEPHPFDAAILKPVDGMIIHFHTGIPVSVGTGNWVNTTPPISPLIDTATFANWPSDLNINILFAGNHLTNASPVLEHFSLANGPAPTYPNPPDPRLGFGHGIVVHKRTHINDCAVIGFPGDGIRLVGTTGPHRFLEGMRISLNHSFAH